MKVVEFRNRILGLTKYDDECGYSITHLILDENDGLYVLRRNDQCWKLGLVTLDSVQLMVVEEKFIDVSDGYDEDKSHWLEKKSYWIDRKSYADHIIVYDKPVISKEFAIRYHHFNLLDGHLGTDVHYFNDDAQEIGFYAYLRKWLDFRATERGNDPKLCYPYSKEIEKELAQVHLNTGLCLRCYNVEGPSLKREGAGPLDDKDTYEHFEDILSSI